MQELFWCAVASFALAYLFRNTARLQATALTSIGVACLGAIVLISVFVPGRYIDTSEAFAQLKEQGYNVRAMYGSFSVNERVMVNVLQGECLLLLEVDQVNREAYLRYDDQRLSSVQVSELATDESNCQNGVG